MERRPINKMGRSIKVIQMQILERKYFQEVKKTSQRIQWKLSEPDYRRGKQTPVFLYNICYK